MAETETTTTQGANTTQTASASPPSGNTGATAPPPAPSSPSRLDSLIDSKSPEAPASDTAPPPAATPAPPSGPAKYKFRGREYTAAELEAGGLLNDALTTAEQFPHLQRKYTETLEADRQRQLQPQPPQQMQPIPQTQIRAH